MRRARSSPAGSAGVRTRSRSGTIAASSTTPSTITMASSESCIASPSTATARIRKSGDTGPMASFKTLDDIDVRSKRVLLRADLNVPVKAGVVTDATRIERLPLTIEALIDKGAKLIVMSHFGRPKGGPYPALSLRPLTAPLEKAIAGRKVAFAADCIGDEAKR